MTIHRGIDISAYQINLPWPTLKANGVDFAVIKGDQDLATDSHVVAARAAGVDVQLYFWHDPTFPPATQINWFLDDIRQWQPSAIWLDCEQSWASWPQYWERIHGTITDKQLLRLPPKSISDNALAVLQGLKKYTSIPLGIYTGQWFVRNYALPMAGWIDQYPLWLASYFDSGTPYPATWDFINSKPPATFDPILRIGQPWIPKTYQILQYSSRMIAPGMRSQLDWDIQGMVVAPPAFIPWTGTIAAWATPHVNIRPTPGTAQPEIGDLKPGAKVTIIGQSAQSDGLWGQIAVPVAGWIRLDFVVKG